jgi:DNA repair exonuclease SbcCD ATPase subunit/DNA repair exonuclease SbcCD nuclease subunit
MSTNERKEGKDGNDKKELKKQMIILRRLEREERKRQRELEREEKLLEKEEKERRKKLVQAAKERADKELEDKEKLTLAKTIKELITKQSVKSNYEPLFQIISDDSNKIIKKIIHIADIHIRLSTRHVEYNEVFEEFYIELVRIKLSEPDCLVCLCGDLLESKDELKPDTIFHTWNFLKNISLIFPLIIISGNHDRIEQNDNKYDSIQAILDDRPIENIYYLQNTGVYIYNNVIFGVNSIVDKVNLNVETLDNLLLEKNPEIYNKYQKDQIKKICLYHGAVENATNNFNFLIPGCKKLNDFGPYDYIMLGDIHKYQYLNPEKTVAYCSSMISQNMSETDKYHGYLEWDILEKKSSYHILSNPYANHKINIRSLLDEDNKLNMKLVEKHLSYILGGTLKIEVEESKDELIDKNSIKYQIEKYIPKLTIWFATIYDKTKPIKSNELTELTEIEPINDDQIMESNQDQIMDELKIKDDKMDLLIKKYLREKENITEENLMNTIMEYFKQKTLTESGIGIKTGSKYFNKEWKILWLSFDYMFGYGPNNVIDFTTYPDNEIIGIFGNNAIGKSSLIDIITFLLFHKTCREDTLKDIININSHKSIGVIVFEANKQKYMIQKECFRNILKKNITSGQQIKVEMTMYKLINSEDKNMFPLHGKYYKLYSLTEKDRYKTTEALETLIGDLQNFILTSVLLQGNHGTFKSKDNKQKKEFLCRVLNIDHFSNCEKDILDHYKKIRTQITVTKRTLENITNMSREEINDKINALQNQTIPIINEQINSNNDLITNMEKLIFDSQAKLIKIESSNIQTESDLILTNNNILKLKQQHSDILREKDSYEKELNELNMKLGQLDLIQSKEKIIQNYSKFISEMDEEINKIRTKIDTKIKLKQSFCLSKINSNLNMTQIQTKISELNEQLDQSTKKKLSLIKSLEILDERISEMDPIISKKEQIIESNTKYQNDQKRSISEINVKLSELNFTKIVLMSKIIQSDQNHIGAHIGTIDELENLKLEHLTFINNPDVPQLLKSKNKIISNYNKFNQSQKDSIYELLEEIKTNQFIQDELNERIDTIKNILDYLLNPNSNPNQNIIVKRYNLLMKFEADYSNANSELAKINEQISILTHNNQINEQIKLIDKEIKDLNMYLETRINSNHLTDEYENLQLILEKYSELGIERSDIMLKLNTINNQIDNLMKQIKDLKVDKSNIEQNNLIQNRVNEIDEQIEKLNQDIQNLDNDKILNKIYNTYTELNKQLDMSISYNQQIILLKQNIINANTETEGIYKQIQIYLDDIEIYKKNIKNILMNDEIKKEIEMCRLELTKYNVIQKDLITRLSECNFNIRNLEEKRKEIQQTETEIENLSKELELYRVLSSMVSINGLQLYLLDKYLDKISQRINNILEPFIHKNIKLVLHKDRIDMVIYQELQESTNSEKKQIYTLSGMENFMLDLSLIVIINQISEIPQSNILFIDESISVLDKNRLENISELFMFIKQYFKQTYMITHMKQVKSQIDYNLEINKLNDFSLIYNVPNVMVLKLNKMKDHGSNNINNIKDTEDELFHQEIINQQIIDQEIINQEITDDEIQPKVSKKKTNIKKVINQTKQKSI